ncbi:MAG: hypothetical protein JWM44_4318 [Bacilli bacterium]|nr:hypothetical protein [Bacilli bacterium]
MQKFLRKLIVFTIILSLVQTSFLLTPTFAAVSGSFTINNGDVFTNNNKVTLSLQAIGAKTMTISESSNFSGAKAETYKTSRLWTLSSGDGSKTVYVKFKDGSGNESPIYSETIYLDTVAPSNGNITINNGDNSTSDANVTVLLSAADATALQMMISESSSFTGAVWQSFATVSSLTMSSGDGQKIVYAKFKDAAGNESLIVSDSILLDTSSNLPTVKINSANGFVTSSNITLTLFSSGATEMMISESSVFTNAVWQPYSTSKSFTLSSSDGLKIVYAKFRDASAKVSPVVSDSVDLDTVAPGNIGILINNGAASTNNSNVLLSLSAAGAVQMMVSESASFTGAIWEAYSITKSFTLSGGDATKTIYVKYKDSAGNVSGVANAFIILDTTPTTGVSIIIQGGATFTNNLQAAVTLTATGATEMELSEQSSFNDVTWGPFASTATFKLSQGEGLKTIYARFRDAAGNVSLAVNDTITLDMTKPANSYVFINNDDLYTSSGNVTLTLSAIGADEVIISESNQFTNATWTSYSTTKSITLSTGDGVKTIFVKFRDLAGNETNIVSDSIVLDTTKPIGSVTINDGSSYTNQINVKLNISASDSNSVIIQLSNSSTFEDASWEPIVSEKSFTLSGIDGTKTVYAKFMDAAGNITEVNDGIVLDTVNPLVSNVSINNDAGFTNSTNVMLHIQASDANPLLMMVSEDAEFSSVQWETYLPNRSFTLSSGDGVKTVFVKLIDAAGNQSVMASDTITLDTLAPSNIGMSINPNTGYTRTNLIDLTLSAVDTNPIQMIISENAAFTGANWEAYSSSRSFTLSSGDGNKTVFVKFKDAAENQSASISANIILDTSAPTGLSIHINNDDPYINDKNVTLHLAAEDANAIEMMMSENASFIGAQWEPFQQTRSFTLSNGDGNKTIYVMFRDNVGNSSEAISAQTVLDTQAPENINIKINQDATYTKDRIVALGLTAADSLVMKMMISENDAFAGALWEDYASNRSFTLSAGDGSKAIFVKFRDAAGNESAIISDTIILDMAVPMETSVKINSDAEYTNSMDVSLTLAAKDASPLEMMVSEDVLFANAQWDAYQAARSFTLSNGDGTKQVYVKFRDAAGNISEAVSDSIILDTAAPGSVGIVINDTVAYTNTHTVNLALAATDAHPIQMLISEKASFADAEWTAFQSNLEFTLSATDGTKTVYAKFKDAAGNESVVTSDSIVLDTAAPSNTSVKIDNDASYAVSANVVLDLTATDTNSLEMLISEDVSFTGIQWEAYQTTRVFTLSQGDGTKSVHVKFRDAAGNESAVTSDNIVLDTTAPIITSMKINQDAEYTNAKAVQLNLAAMDANPLKFSVSEDTHSIGGDWKPLQSDSSFTLSGDDGTKTVYVQLKDAAGNLSEVASDTIILDTAAPSGTDVKINEDAAYTNAAKVTLTLAATDAHAIQLIVSEDQTFADAAWENYTGQRESNLSDGDGTKTVYAKFRDAAGNESAIVSDTIILDTIAPMETSAKINSDAGYTNSMDVSLTLAAKDASPLEIMVSEDALFANAQWEAYQAVRAFTLSNGDGTKQVYVKFRDAAGNISESVSDSIILDTAAPSSVGIVINDAAAYTNTHTVNLALAATDAHAIQMLISEKASFADAEWTAFQSNLEFTLSAEDGTKTVYAKFKDAAGNISNIVNDSINLDTIAPTQISLKINNGAGFTNSQIVTLTISAVDTSSIQIMLSEDQGFANAQWETYSSTRTFTLSSSEGTKKVFVKFRDAANNTAVTSAGIVLDMSAPSIAYTGNAGTYTIDQIVNIKCTASDNGSGIASNTCKDITDPAYKFKLGMNSFSATAMDRAGNTATGTTSFTVIVTIESLSNLVRQFVTNDHLVEVLCKKLESIDHHNIKSRDNVIDALINQISAKKGKSIEDDKANTIISLANALKNQ